MVNGKGKMASWATASVLGMLISASAMASPLGPTIVLHDGPIRGSVEDGVEAFKGIPFAAAPVGRLRWRAPEPPAPWRTPRDATRFGPDCMQKPFPSDAAPLGTTPSEDCLYVNVWKPVGMRGLLPVMVWIYGGGFVNGGASPPTYSGSPLARRGIIVVSFNYRLGRFGTFVHPSLTSDEAGGVPVVNFSTLDQLAALRWVRDNVAAFGGDPGKVTIVGESAGGMSAHALLTSPLSHGLFRGAFIQSGGPVDFGDNLETAKSAGLAFASSRGVRADDPDAATKLRSLSAEEVVGDLNLATLFSPPDPSKPKTFTLPVVDGRIQVDPVAAYRSGAFTRVPLVIGVTSNDLGGPSGMMVTGARFTGALASAAGSPVWEYRFSYVATSARKPGDEGAGHATDIPFFMDTVDAKYGSQTSASDRAIANVMSGYLVNFVKTGDPNGGGLVHWDRYSTQRADVIDFTIDATATMTSQAGEHSRGGDR